MINELNHKINSDEEANDYIEPKLVFKGCTTNTCNSESNELIIHTWLKTLMKIESTGKILADTECILYHPTGTEEEITTNIDGYIIIEDLKIGKYKIALKTTGDG